MAKKHIIGLTKIEIGDIAGDGGVATTFVEVGDTVIGSAKMSSQEGTTTDFFIEESDSPVESFESTPSKLILSWSTSNVGAVTLGKFLGGTVTEALGANRILTHGSITGGTGYTNGTYLATPLTGGTGTGAVADITVAGGIVTVVTFPTGGTGTGYTVADALSAATSIIGSGTGFTTPVATIGATAVAEKYELPDTLPAVEKSVRVTDKKGHVVVFPRVKIKTIMGLSFTKDQLGQIDMTGTILQSDKAGTKRMTITYAA